MITCNRMKFNGNKFRCGEKFGLIITWDIFGVSIIGAFLFNYLVQIKIWFKMTHHVSHFTVQRNTFLLFVCTHSTKKKDSWRCERIIVHAHHQSVGSNIITFTQQSNGQQPNAQLHVSSRWYGFDCYFDRSMVNIKVHCGEHQFVPFCLLLLDSFSIFVSFFRAFYRTIGQNKM